MEWCQGTSGGGGCSTRVWMRRERWRDGHAAGGHPRFLGNTYPAILVPSPAPTSCRKHTGAGLHEHPMRDLAKPGPARRPGRSRRVSREGMVRGIAHRVKPEWRVAGRCGGKGVSEKMRMAPCRASIRLPFPPSPGKSGATRDGRRARHGVAHRDPGIASRHTSRATKSAMNLFFSVLPYPNLLFSMFSSRRPAGCCRRSPCSSSPVGTRRRPATGPDPPVGRVRFTGG